MFRVNLLIYCPTRLLAIAIPSVTILISNSVRIMPVTYISIELVNSTYNNTVTTANPNTMTVVPPPPLVINIRRIRPIINTKIASVDAYASGCCTVGDVTYYKFSINAMTNNINIMYFLSVFIFVINDSEVDDDILNIY